MTLGGALCTVTQGSVAGGFAPQPPPAVPGPERGSLPAPAVHGCQGPFRVPKELACCPGRDSGRLPWVTLTPQLGEISQLRFLRRQSTLGLFQSFLCGVNFGVVDILTLEDQRKKVLVWGTFAA